MNSLNWWQNALCEFSLAVFMCAFLAIVGWLKTEAVPTWGYYLACMIGVVLWTRPPYDRQRDFDK